MFAIGQDCLLPIQVPTLPSEERLTQGVEPSHEGLSSRYVFSDIVVLGLYLSLYLKW